MCEHIINTYTVISFKPISKNDAEKYIKIIKKHIIIKHKNNTIYDAIYDEFTDSDYTTSHNIMLSRINSICVKKNINKIMNEYIDNAIKILYNKLGYSIIGDHYNIYNKYTNIIYIDNSTNTLRLHYFDIRVLYYHYDVNIMSNMENRNHYNNKYWYTTLLY